MDPYLVVRNRAMLFEETVMRACGMEQIPTFDNPTGQTEESGASGAAVLGKACGGKKIEACHGWLQERAPKRTVEGRELKMVISEEQLAEALCRVCKKG